MRGSGTRCAEVLYTSISGRAVSSLGPFALDCLVPSPRSFSVAPPVQGTLTAQRRSSPKVIQWPVRLGLRGGVNLVQLRVAGCEKGLVALRVRHYQSPGIVPRHWARTATEGGSRSVGGRVGGRACHHIEGGPPSVCLAFASLNRASSV